MTHILHRHLRVTPPVAVSDQGVYLTDASGSQYLDACGGAEAVEAALKMARQYFVEIGEPERSVFVARRQFAPLLINVKHVAPCYAYRDRIV